MAHTYLYLTHDNTLVQRGRRKHELLRAAINKAMGVVSGSERGTNFTFVGSGTDPATACSGIIIGADPSGAVGGVINGVTLTDTWTTSATVSAGLVATAINASTDALVQYLVGATNFKARITLTTVVAGNSVTIAGFRFTGVAGTAASIPAVDGNFVIKGSGTDTQSATSLAGAINRHTAASKWLFAYNIASVVHVHPKSAAWFTAATSNGPNFPPNKIISAATPIAATDTTFAAGIHCGVWSKIPGKLGNAITIAASGGNVTIENTNTRLTRGLGGDAAPITDNI